MYTDRQPVFWPSVFVLCARRCLEQPQSTTASFSWRLVSGQPLMEDVLTPTISRVDIGFGSQVESRVLIGVRGEIAVLAQKLSLALTVGLRAVAALRTGSAGVARVNEDHANAGQMRLVRHERLKLMKSPAGMLRPLLTINRDALPNALEIFKNDYGSGAFGFSNEFLADPVILVSTKVTLVSPDLTQSAPGRLGADVVQSGPPLDVALPDLFHLLPGENLAGGIGSQIHDTKVYPQGVIDFDWRRFGHVYGAKQKQFLVSVDKIGLPFDSTLQCLLVGPTDEGHTMPSGESPEAHFGQALEAQNALVIGYGPVWLERGALRLVAAEALNGFGDGPNCHLRRQAEAVPDRTVAKSVDTHLAKDTGVKANLGGKGGRFIESFHRGE